MCELEHFKIEYKFSDIYWLHSRLFGCCCSCCWEIEISCAIWFGCISFGCVSLKCSVLWEIHSNGSDLPKTEHNQITVSFLFETNTYFALNLFNSSPTTTSNYWLIVISFQRSIYFDSSVKIVSQLNLSGACASFGKTTSNTNTNKLNFEF